MKVKGIESAHFGLLLVIMLALLLAAAPYSAVASADDKDSDKIEDAHREARKAMRKGKYERAGEIYQSLLGKNAQDLQALLGASFAFLKLQDYVKCYDYAAKAVKLDLKSSRARALAGIALL